MKAPTGYGFICFLIVLAMISVGAEGTAIGWHDQTTLSASVPGLSGLQLSFAQDGTEVVVWANSSTGHSEVYLASTVDLANWTTERTIASIDGSIRDLHLVRAGDNNFLLSWILVSGQNSWVCACFANTTSTWGLTIGLDGSSSTAKSSLAVDAQSDGWAMIAWIQAGSDNNAVICAYFDPASGWSGPLGVYGNFPEDIQSLSVTMNGKGDCLFALGSTWFGSNYGTYSRLWNKTTGLGSVLAFSSMLGCQQINVRFINADTAVAVWINNRWVWSATFTIGSGWNVSWSPLNIHDDYGTGSLTLVADGNGNAAAAWTQTGQDGSSHNVYVAQYKLSSGFGFGQVVNNAGHLMRTGLDIALNPQGLPMVAWCEWQLSINGSMIPSHIVSNRYRSDSGWTGPRTVFDSNIKIWMCKVGSASNQSVSLVWSEGDQENSQTLKSIRYNATELPQEPQGLSAEGSDASAQLAWDALPASPGYVLQHFIIYRASESFGPFENVGSTETTDFTDHGLTNGNTYWYRICVLYDKGEGDMSGVVHTKAHTVPLKVPWLDAIVSDDRNVSLSWGQPLDGGEPILGYHVLRWDPADHLTTLNVTDRGYLDVGLTLDGTYTYAVLAYSATGYGEQSDLSKVIFALDTIDPTIQITSPTSATDYSTSQNRIVLGGTALDDVGVANITWSNSRGGSGMAVMTGNSWSVSSIPLLEGDNVISVTVQDAANNSAMTLITVTYSPQTPGGTDGDFGSGIAILTVIASTIAAMLVVFLVWRRRNKA
jgi:hypothetical protein